ncbi:MAG: hypothetical protein NC548_35200 [Lachnospiraceae bacterium]|nr:hypothetical protein [Lachnospiraceae bacterium]
MKFTVTGVTTLPTRAGNGLKVGDVELGCARIANVELEEGVTLLDCAREGLCLGYHPDKVPVEPVNPEADTPQPRTILALETENLDRANNYVLVIVDPKTNSTSVVLNTLDITNLYELPEEDAKTMNEYIEALANQRNLTLIRYTDGSTGEESFFFTNQFDRELNEDILASDDPEIEGDAEIAAAKYLQLMNSPQFRSELETHNFIKMFVVDLVHAGENRYNKLHRDDVIEELAAKLCQITYWCDGVLCVPSIADIEDYMNHIKGDIRVAVPKK